MSEKKPKVTIDDIYELLKEVNNNLTTKIEKIDQDLKTISAKVSQEIEETKDKVTTLETENSELKRRIEETERKLKSNNLIVYGIKEDNLETTASLVDEIEKIIKEKLELNLNSSEITNTYRIGKDKGKKRPILVTINSQMRKREILKNCYKLKGTNIYISEDLIGKDLEERKILVNYMKEARKNNKQASIRGNKLLVDGNLYSIQELEDNNIKKTDYFSPPPERRATSEPSTPNVFVDELEEKTRENIHEVKEEKKLDIPDKKKTARKQVEHRPSPTSRDTPRKRSATRSTTSKRN
ncbi:unnamed protein product [Phaedon cochleariae]|uniref:Endonuclease-reverse transcriptase n=1 Tax=Phaedon cochleariae TaxID=80249 RepID=A0A9N9SKR1_PHACE|nr:unnamed protein product [Phaedon cochleariae]